MPTARKKPGVASVTDKPFARRTSGVLLHVTSLPGSGGIGDLGKAAYRWVDALAGAGQTWWQILPLGPPGEGNSPYKCFSAFAGNPALVSFDGLLSDGLLGRADAPSASVGRQDAVDFEVVCAAKGKLLAGAWERYQAGAASKLRNDFDQFCEANTDWLDDFALFMALREATHGQHWTQWSHKLVTRNRATLRQARDEMRDAVGRHQFAQFLFARQLRRLRDYARSRGIKLMGDVPIYVSDDSADVWSNAHLFQLDRQRRPKSVAGVPPDGFSATGQCWGNPTYDWSVMAREKFDWWVRRLRATLKQVDVVRLDHFRGFAGYWSIPARTMDATKGRWVSAPGEALFTELQKQLGDLPVIAEDLGVITPDVAALRDQFNLPGMRILQFAFSGDDSAYLPHNYKTNSIAYTGTHDNDTTQGWWDCLKKADRARVAGYAPNAEKDPVGALIRLAWSSIANCAVVPMQDILRLGSEARMNMPGQRDGNWSWRMGEGDMRTKGLNELGEMTRAYRRSMQLT